MRVEVYPEDFAKQLAEEGWPEKGQELIRREGYMNENGDLEVYLFDIAGGNHGVYQFQVVADYFGIDFLDEYKTEKEMLEELEFIWDGIETYAHYVAVRLSEYAPGWFYFGRLETDSSFGLFYLEENHAE